MHATKWRFQAASRAAQRNNPKMLKWLRLLVAPQWVGVQNAQRNGQAEAW
jgi:hypothetical protein